MYTVEFYESPSGKTIVKDIYLSLSKRQQSKISRAMLNLKEYGISQIVPNIRKLSGTPLWEYRILGKDNMRIICVVIINRKVMVLNIFLKKKQKTPKKEINISLERYKLVIDN